MNSNLEKIINRINQLRALSKSTHSKAEAETTATIAAKLIAEYQISEAVLASQTGGAKENQIDTTSEHIIYESGRISLWKAELAIGIAELNGLFIYNAWIRNSVTHRKVIRYRIIGRQGDIQIALYMMNYLLQEISSLADAYVPNFGKRGISSERESYCLGCVRGFIQKMNEQKKEVMKTATSQALVFIGNKAKEAEAAWQQATGKTLAKSHYYSKAQKKENFYENGFAKGQTISVNRAMKE